MKEDPALLLQMQAPFLEVSNQPTPGFEFAEIFDLKGGAEHHHELGVRLDDPVTPEDVIINTWKVELQRTFSNLKFPVDFSVIHSPLRVSHRLIHFSGYI